MWASLFSSPCSACGDVSVFFKSILGFFPPITPWFRSRRCSYLGRIFGGRPICWTGNWYSIRQDLLVGDDDGRTPLSWAAQSGHDAVVKLLLDKGTELETKDSYDQTPLSWAAQSGHDAVVKLLLDKGANISMENKSDWTAL